MVLKNDNYYLIKSFWRIKFIITKEICIFRLLKNTCEKMLLVLMELVYLSMNFLLYIWKVRAIVELWKRRFWKQESRD